MTAPNRERFAASDYHQFRFLPLSIDVVCANDVLEAIRVEAVNGFNRLSHGGLETGGILFGRHTERSVEILASQPLECEHRTGPSFVLSKKDEMALQAALADPKPRILQPIGLYMAHSRRGFSLAETDWRILDRYFPKPWQMALLLMPAKLGPTRAGFFIRSLGGKPAYLCAHEFLLHAPERHGNSGESERADNLNTPPDSEKIPSRAAAAVAVDSGERAVAALDREEIQPAPLAAAAVPGPSSAVAVDSGERAVAALDHEEIQPAPPAAAAVPASSSAVPADTDELAAAASDHEEIQLARLAAAVGASSSAVRADTGELAAAASDREEVRTGPFATVAVVPAPSGPEPVDRHALELDRFHAFLAQEEEQRRVSWWKLIATLALVILCVAIAGSLWTRSRVVPSPSIPLHIGDLGPNLRIEWDPTREAVRAATGATLEIREGDNPPVYLPITREGLYSGGVVYAPRSEKIGVRLKLLRGNELASESQLYLFINPVRSADSPPPEPVPAATPQDARSVASAPVSERQSEEPVQTRTQKQAQAPNSMQQSFAPIRIAVRAFNPPVKRSFGSADVGAQVSPPDLPEIATAQPSLPVPLPSASLMGVRPPPPAPVAPPVAPQTRAPDPPQPRSGRLIWTGDLRKNRLLSLSPAGASVGALNGRLPGFPVKISVQPAELVDGGIAIFSSDRTRAGTGETPSARNGWNVVVYKWDPRRTSEVTIIEPPGPSNGWRQLVLRNGNHNVSVLVVDWQREGG